MKLTIFPSDKGDCTLLTSKDGKRILADGGMPVSYTSSVAPVLTKLREATGNTTIDVVYVSHIDEDHIGGVLQMLDDAIDWRVFEHKTAKGSKIKEPKSFRPPEIGQVWHNGFREQLGDNSGPMEDQLAASAAVLAGASEDETLDDDVRLAVVEQQELTESVKQAIQLGRRISDGELGITLNKPAKRKVMLVGRPANAIKVGTMQAHVIGPRKEDLEVLRKDWNTWVQKSKTVLASIDASSKKTEKDLTASAGSVVAPLLGGARGAALALVSAMATAFTKDLAKAIGHRSSVTPPNLASLMLLVVEGKRTILLTGDGYAGDALEGLRKRKLLKNGSLHVDVLKVPHHGAADNMTDDFAKAVTADNYVFCGNGFKTNPELVVIQRLFDARRGDASKRSLVDVDRDFVFWFNCSSAVDNKANQKAHMKKVEKFVAGLKKKSGGKMTTHFLGPKDHPFEIAL